MDNVVKQNDEVNIIVEVSDIDHILSAPDKDPYSSMPAEYMGQSAISRCLKTVKEERGWDKKRYRFTFLVPAEQLGRRSEAEIKAAIRRFCDTLRQDNLLQLHVIRHRGFKKLPYSFIILFTCVSSGIIIGSPPVVDLAPWLATVISEGLYVIGWVSLWGPTETLFFEPLELRTDNKVLDMIKEVEIEVRANPNGQ